MVQLRDLNWWQMQTKLVWVHCGREQRCHARAAGGGHTHRQTLPRCQGAVTACEIATS